MSFDIPDFKIPDNSPEAKLIEEIVTRDHVSPKEAVLSALRGLAAETDLYRTTLHNNPGELLFGAFADDPEVILKIASDARKSRNREVVKPIG